MLIDPEFRQKLLVAAVYYCVIEWLADITESLGQSLMSEWSIDRERFDRLNIRRAPTRTQNLFIAFECYKKFGPALGSVPGFYQAEASYDEPLWWLDIDPLHSRTGFILPERDPQYGFIDRLRVFRGPRDSQGFILTTREECQRRAA